MYTQCPNCDTPFRISITQIKAAQGKVRCGNCSNVFNALLNLSEQAQEIPTVNERLGHQHSKAEGEEVSPKQADTLKVTQNLLKTAVTEELPTNKIVPSQPSFPAGNIAEQARTAHRNGAATFVTPPAPKDAEPTAGNPVLDNFNAMRVLPDLGSAISAPLRNDASTSTKEDAAARERILVIDDSRVVRRAIAKILSPYFEMIEAADGEAGWQALLTDPTIGIVISDIEMPNLDGHALLQRIRKSDNRLISDIPVIVITGADDTQAKEKAYALHASDFITKPIDSVQLVARAHAYLKISQANRRQAADAAALEQPADQSPGISSNSSGNPKNDFKPLSAHPFKNNKELHLDHWENDKHSRETGLGDARPSAGKARRELMISVPRNAADRLGSERYIDSLPIFPDRRTMPRSPEIEVAGYDDIEDYPQPPAQTYSWLSTGGWTLGILALLALLLVQFAYFMRDDLAGYLALRPGLEKFCAVVTLVAECDIPLRRDLTQIESLASTVQPHPEVPDALLANITLVNKANFYQPFPHLQLTLSDINGKIIAKRRFHPNEYLGANINIKRGMSPNVAFPVNFEVATPSTNFQLASWSIDMF